MPATTKRPPPTTPDGRYIVVQGVLWRATNANLAPADRARFVSELMDARRAVKKYLHADAEGLKGARAQVQAAKEALGERGPPWWQDGAPCLNRHKVELSVYAAWYASLDTADANTTEGP